MLADMTIRSFGDKTKHDYIRHVEILTAFLGRSPDTVTADDLRRFQLHQVEQGAQPPKLNSQARPCASSSRSRLAARTSSTSLRHALPRKLPRILSAEDVLRLLEAAPGSGLKYKAALSIAHGAGLRCGEVMMLRGGDIDSERMLIRVEIGKGRKAVATRRPIDRLHRAAADKG
jgi:integrase/recombinase XerD